MNIYTNNSTINIPEHLKYKIKKAEQTLTALCDNPLLLELLESVENWAIVGGAVRDAIINDNEDLSFYIKNLKDIDIALSHNPIQGPLSNKESNDVRVKVSHNHFGGIKASLHDFIDLDLWVWKDNNGTIPNENFWREKLSSIDFGINAIAFVWPLRKIIMHPRWIVDFQRSQVEKLSWNSPRQELQPIRAIALATKLEIDLGHKVHLGPDITRDFRWLVCEEDSSKLDNAVSYLREKVYIHRWPSETMDRFTKLYQEYNGPKPFPSIS